jgi:hypothetical protein
MTAAHKPYSWSHGWVPLTPKAALEKAHGNEWIANKYMGFDAGRHGASPKWRKRSAEARARRLRK